MSPRTTGAALGLLIGLLFFISGFTGLVYEVIWAKYLALLLGSTAYAQVGVLAVFMGGLAAGSVVWGGRVDRGRRALAMYGVLEIGIGLCAAVFAWGFEALSQGYWGALATVGTTGPAADVVKTGLCVVAMFPATFCMGGTLPVLSRALGLDRRGLGRGVAYLYAVNSLGAAVGAVFTGFSLVATWGFDAPFFGAALVNVGVGLVALAASAGVSDRRRAARPPENGATVAVTEIDDVRGYASLVLVGAAVSGAVAMIYEVAWIRLCSLVLGSSTYSFSIMLTAFITGIAAGSLVYSLTDPARRRPLRFFGYSSLVAAATLLLCLPGYERLPFYLGRLTAILRQRDAAFATYQAATLLFCVAVMLPLTFVSGLNFPALAHAAGQVRAGIGRPVSRVLFANTAGTICGAVVGGLYLLPAAGLHGTFLVGITATVLVALVVLGCDRGIPRRRVRLISAGSLAVLTTYAVIGSGWDLRLLVAGEFRRHEGIEAGSFAEYRAGLEQQLLFYKDGISATVSVERQPPDEVTLRVNGKADASAQGDRDTELLSGHLPAILHPTARRALVIGYGSGITVGALLRHPIESVDIVEISPEVIAADEQFRRYNHDPLHDPRAHLYVEDARTFLYRAEGQYDLIVSEPSNPWIAGIANLFTVEFFDQVRSRLAPDGLLLQWFHTYETSDTLVRLILRTVAQGFEEVRVFQPNRWDVFVVASPGHRTVRRAAMEAAFGDAAELGEVGIHRVATVLGLEMLADAGVRRQAGAGVVNRDRIPVLEYMAPRAFFDGRNAGLIAKGGVEDDAGFVQPTRGLGEDDYRDLATYLKKADLLHYDQALRVVVAWLAHAPLDPAAARMLTDWITSNPSSPLLLPALAGAASSTMPAMRADYAGLLMRVVWSLHLKPAARDVAAVAPIVRVLAQGSAQAFELLTQLAELFVASGAYADAIETLDVALAQSASAGVDGAAVPSPLHCVRGRAFEKLGNAAAARAALALCRPRLADAAGPSAESQHLDQSAP